MQQISRTAKPGDEGEDGEHIYRRDAAVVPGAAMYSMRMPQVKMTDVTVPKPSHNRQKAQHQSRCKTDEEEGLHVIYACFLRLPFEYALLRLPSELSPAPKVNRSTLLALRIAAGVR